MYTKKILANIVAIILILPVFLIFNPNLEVWYVNVLALAYGVIMSRRGHRILPMRVLRLLKDGDMLP